MKLPEYLKKMETKAEKTNNTLLMQIVNKTKSDNHVVDSPDSMDKAGNVIIQQAASLPQGVQKRAHFAKKSIGEFAPRSPESRSGRRRSQRAARTAPRR